MIFFNLPLQKLIQLPIRSCICQPSVLIALLVVYYVYYDMTALFKRIGKNRPPWSRVFVSNAISTPVNSVLFPLIGFSGIISATAMTEKFYTNITVKAIITLLAFWTIYLVPEEKNGTNSSVSITIPSKSRSGVSKG